jgi:Xaa-Pro aminopeptidase
MMVPGVNGRDVDAMVREKFGAKGYAEYFGHGLGHGLGRVVHDLGRLSPTTDQPIEVGQVWTIEPGIYVLRLTVSGSTKRATRSFVVVR